MFHVRIPVPLGEAAKAESGYNLYCCQDDKSKIFAIVLAYFLSRKKFLLSILIYFPKRITKSKGRPTVKFVYVLYSYRA